MRFAVRPASGRGESDATTGAHPYRGEDRRGLIPAERRSPGPLFVVAAASLLVLVALLLTLAWVGPATGRGDPLLVAQLDAAAWSATVLLAVLCFLRWRLVGDAAALWLAVAAGILGLFTLGLGHVLAHSLTAIDGSVSMLQPASRLVVLGLVVGALLVPEVDATIRPGRLVAAALATTASVTVLFQIVPIVGAVLLQPADGTAAVAPSGPVAAVVLLACFGGLGAVAVSRGLRSGRHLLAWFGLLLLSLGFAELVAGASPGHVVDAVGPSLLRAMGLLCAVLGASGELARAYAAQSSKLLESRTSERAERERAEAVRATQAEREHEARNALLAIGGAVSVLKEHHEGLEPAERTQLSRAIASEVQRLQGLVSSEATRARAGRFRVTEVLAAVVTAARSQGSRVTVDVPEDLVAIGQPADTAQVLHNLFQNACRYAGGHISVRGALEGDRAVIRIEDDGPGIPAAERDRIFHRGVRGRAAGSTTGSGLGLYVSARLMQEQGGEIRVEDADTGACFALVLPGFAEAAVERAVGQQSLEEPEQLGELGAQRDLTLVPFPFHTHRGARRVEDQDRVRGDVAT